MSGDRLHATNESIAAQVYKETLAERAATHWWREYMLLKTGQCVATEGKNPQWLREFEEREKEVERLKDSRADFLQRAMKAEMENESLKRVVNEYSKTVAKLASQICSGESNYSSSAKVIADLFNKQMNRCRP